MIQLEVRSVCRCGYVLYVMTRRLLKLHQSWVRLKLGAEKGAHHLEQARSECALIKAHTYICRHPLHCSAFVHPHLHFNMTQQMVLHSDHLLSTSNLHFAHSIPPPSPFPLPLCWHEQDCVTRLHAAKLLLHAILWDHTVITFTHPAEEEEEEAGRAAEE